MFAQTVVTILSLFIVSVCGYLTINQWKVVQTIITQEDVSDTIKEKVRLCIFKNYNNWAIHKAYDFKKLHKYKCRHIKIEELSLYASCGLWQAIQKYDGVHSFPHFASFYISGELYKGLTKLYPISSVPKKIRVQRKTGEQKQPMQLSIIYYGKDTWLLDNNQIDDTNTYDEYTDIWVKINDIEDPFTKKIFHYKYNFYLDKIRTNKEISLLMCCSEEKVRNTLVKEIEKLL